MPLCFVPPGSQRRSCLASACSLRDVRTFGRLLCARNVPVLATRGARRLAGTRPLEWYVSKLFARSGKELRALPFATSGSSVNGAAYLMPL